MEDMGEKVTARLIGKEEREQRIERGKETEGGGCNVCFYICTFECTGPFGEKGE